MIPTPTNADMDRLLAQEPYLGAEHLQSQYKEIWSCMRQEKFLSAKEVLRGIKKGEKISQELVAYARPIVMEVAKKLDSLAQDEIALTIFKNLTENRKDNIRS